jgi:hypothetical protein
VDDDPLEPGRAAGDPDAMVVGEVGGGVGGGQHPALGDEGAVAVEEGHDRGPVGLLDQAVGVEAVVSNDQARPPIMLLPAPQRTMSGV